MQDIIKSQDLIKTEEDYLELERLSRKLGIPVPMVWLKLVSTLDGEVIGSYEGRSRTWNRNYYNAIYGNLVNFLPTGSTFGAGFLTSKRVTAATYNRPFSSNPIQLLGVVNNSNYGIVVGIGTAAESFEGYVMSNQIVHGSTSGTMVHAASNDTTVAYTAGTKTWAATLARIFNNNSGGSITVTETGIIDYAGNVPSMVCRDLLGATVPVANGGQLTVTYTMSLAFPE